MFNFIVIFIVLHVLVIDWFEFHLFAWNWNERL